MCIKTPAQKVADAARSQARHLRLKDDPVYKAAVCTSCSSNIYLIHVN